MLRRQIPIFLLIASIYPCLSNARADEVWQGSYSVDGQCFCSGEISGSVASAIVPTPIGGQTVRQVCNAVGKGPGLTVQNGLFNYTVYKDPQCGNGPFVRANGPRDPDCVGTTDGTYGSCQSAGPRWDLAQAYGANRLASQASPDTSDTAKSGAKLEVAASKASSLPEMPTGASALRKKLEADIALAKQKKSIEDFNIESFKGKSIVLGDDRYLQAREGLSAQGGAPGSRIILDGMLFIREDDSLLMADLYQGDAPPVVAAAEPAKESVPKAKPVSPAKTRLPIKPKVVEKPRVAPKKKIVATKPVTPAKKPDNTAELQARLAVQQIQREANARADYEAEQQARDARIAEQNRKVTEEKLAEKNKLVELTDDKAQIKPMVVTDEKLLAGPSEQADSAVNRTDEANDTPTLQSARPFPANKVSSTNNFTYVEAMPASYDFGGGGVVVEGSVHGNARFQYLARLGVADTYRELMIGGGYYVRPVKATRMTVALLAGVEFGRFELSDEERLPEGTTLSDNGIYLGAMSRFVISSKFELKGGVGYSSFFDGDATIFGGGYYHVTPRLDVMSHFELGDNDLLGIGIRYYY